MLFSNALLQRPLKTFPCLKITSYLGLLGSADNGDSCHKYDMNIFTLSLVLHVV